MTTFDRPVEADLGDVLAGGLGALRVDLDRRQRPLGPFKGDTHLDGAIADCDADLDTTFEPAILDEEAQHHGVAFGRAERS